MERRRDQADAFREFLDEVVGRPGVSADQLADRPSRRRRGDLVGADQRHRMHLDGFADDEFHARQPDAVVRQLGRFERQSGIAQVEHDRRLRPPQFAKHEPRGLHRQGALVHPPTSPSAQETVTTAPPFSAFLAPSAPTTAGMPSSRATIAA